MTLDDDQVVVSTNELDKKQQAFVGKTQARDESGAWGDAVSLSIFVPGAHTTMGLPPMKARELGMALIAFADAAETRA
jgi:hypothetical protein